MIDVKTETLVRVVDVPGRLPFLVGRARGGRVCTDTVRWWIRRGVGGVRLESVKVGGVLYTSTEAVDRFVRRTQATEKRRPAGART